MIEIFAPAKVNLTLHVTGQRDDGYHLLDSLVCFPNIGDRLTFTPADEMSLTIQGAPDLPCDDSNLVMKAARLYMPDQPQAIVLHKALPIASGIGGGSADAAAVIRAGVQLQAQRPPDETALTLGADVSVCIPSAPSRMRGIGDQLDRLKDWPDTGYILLVNPRVEVSTPAIFKTLTQKTNAPMPSDLPDLTNLDTMINFIASQRNDLQAPAIAQQPIIADVIEKIAATPDCLFARMSGSGATCFGIYRTQEQVLKAAAQVGSDFGDWWVEYGALQH